MYLSNMQVTIGDQTVTANNVELTYTDASLDSITLSGYVTPFMRGSSMSTPFVMESQHDKVVRLIKQAYFCNDHKTRLKTLKELLDI